MYPFHQGVFHARIFCAWWLASASSGSQSSQYGVLARIQGASDSLLRPSPEGEAETSVFGIVVWVLLWATSLPHGMVSSPAPGRGLSVTAFKGRSYALRLSCSEVQGPPILLSYYITRVISCGLEALSGLSPFWVVSLVLQNLLGASWNPSGHTSCAVLLWDALFILASASAGLLG